jgi:hypothetical protein
VWTIVPARSKVLVKRLFPRARYDWRTHKWWGGTTTEWRYQSAMCAVSFRKPPSRAVAPTGMTLVWKGDAMALDPSGHCVAAIRGGSVKIYRDGRVI